MRCEKARKARRYPGIYYARTRQGQIWMLTLYAKKVAETIPARVLRQIKEETDG